MAETVIGRCGTFAVSAMTADRLARLGPAHDAIEVVPNGVDAETIRSITPADDGFDLLFAGRLIPEKNVDRLLSAFDAVADTYDITLGIIGDGSEWSALRAQATSLTHADRVTFLGFVDKDRDVYAHMQAADLFVFPSIREGFGITGLEAMAANCVVVTVSHPDSAAAEVIGDGGFVCQPATASIADTMRHALNGGTPDSDPVERATRFGWDRIAQRAETAYEDAIA
jgi:glycosyltransferase involved in cell wall biosynthesis